MINHKKKTVLKWACGIVAALLVILAAGGWWMFGNAITAANSIEKLGEELYSMEYTGDYGFDAFLAQGGADVDSEVANYLVTFFPAAFTKSKAMCSQGSLAAPAFTRRASRVPSSSGAITTGRSAKS